MFERSAARPLIASATPAVPMMLAANMGFAMVDTSSKWLLSVGYAALQLAVLRCAVQPLIKSGLLLHPGAAMITASGLVIWRREFMPATSNASVS